MNRRIHFKDDGQDILWWDIDEKGVVIACNAQEWVWKGTQVMMDDLSKIKKGMQLRCAFTKIGVSTFIHPVVKVEKIKEVSTPA
jgi:hypothetical protein